MRKLLMLFAATLPVTVAQTPVVIPGITAFPPQLKQYLVLTDEQVAQILDLSRKLTEFQTSKLQRQAQLSLEIARESAKETLDPMALGIRYMELEAIRRQISDEQRKTGEQARALLNDVQKGKVGTLQEVMRQYSTACEAMRFNLLPPALPGNRIPVPGIGGTNISLNPWFDTGSFVSPILIGSSFGCATPLPTSVIRTGDFSDVVSEPSQP
jgi:hypothetical protein